MRSKFLNGHLFPSLQRIEERTCASSSASLSQGSTADPRWDTPFNKAINVIKGRAKSLPPTSAGRVAGYGTYDKVGNFKKEDHEAKKERKAAAAAAVTASERSDVEKLREQMPDLIAEQVQQKLCEIIPDEPWEGLAAWNAAGRQGPLVVPSISGSNSIKHVSPDMVTPDTANIEEAQPAAALVPPPAAANTNAHPEVTLVTPPLADANIEQPIAPVPPPATAKAQPTMLRRKASRRENDTDVSTLAKLNAISKVMTPASTFHFLCL
jgi:hypothetical protein